MTKLYELPKLPYEYQSLSPYISEKLLTLHHQKHHQAYVTGANALLVKLTKAREEKTDLDMKATLRELSFHVGGHILHSLFWPNLTPAKDSGQPEGELAKAMTDEFGSFDRFKREFSQTAISVEGSGWAALAYCQQTGRLLLMQIEKHNLYLYPGFRILLVLDSWEHAFYLDYQTDKVGYVDAFWNIVNWREVGRRFAL